MQRFNHGAGDILIRRIHSTIGITVHTALPRTRGAIEYAALFALAATLWSLVLLAAFDSLS